jgi:hypothetical protein
MKKIYLLLLLTGLFSFTFGQVIYLSEDFSSNVMPPEGWTIDNLQSQWTVQNSNNAGGSAPEARFKYKQTITTSRFISPEIDLTGVASVVLNFKHYLDDYSGSGYKIGVATRAGAKGEWHKIWELAPNDNIGPENKLMTIDNEDVGTSNFQMCFYLEGNMYNLDYWYLDNIKLLVPATLNAELVSITTPKYFDGNAQVTGVIRNFGTNTINSLEIEWEVDGDVHTTTFSDLNLQFGESYDFVCSDALNLPVGSYDLKVTIVKVNGGDDENNSDNLMIKNINVYSHSIFKKICFEEFTSSTCGPCAGFNSQFVPWCNNHEDEMTLIKYQMNWPGSGDPYYTNEGGQRRMYYGVTWVPWLEADGSFCNTNISSVQAALNQAALKPGLMDIKSSFSLEGTQMTINTTVVPFANFNSFKIFVVVFEKETTGNTGNNGETSFQHVMMKMVPDANGTTVDLVDRQPYVLDQTVDLAGTNVEEWSDLGVVVICQEYESREIFQSEYSVENGQFAMNAKLNSITVDGELLEGFNPEVYTYDVVLPEGTTEVPVVEAQLQDENGLKIIVPANNLPGATTIYTYAEDLATHSTYTVNFSIATGVDDNFAKTVNIYPNPTTGKLYVKGVKDAYVKVYSVTGNVVFEQNGLNTNYIDLSILDTGIYFMSLTTKENKTVVKKISIMK